MSVTQSAPDPGEQHFDERARELVHRLVDLFGIRRTRRILWEAMTYLKHEYTKDDQ